jgi:hypothetical protein
MISSRISSSPAERLEGKKLSFLLPISTCILSAGIPAAHSNLDSSAGSTDPSRIPSRDMAVITLRAGSLWDPGKPPGEEVKYNEYLVSA